MTTAGGQQEPAGPLCGAVAALCDRLLPQVSASTAVGFREVSRRLATPLQVAVAGRIKSGKSTLVNALIGRRVAPTAVGECTRLVTRYSYGAVDRIEVIFRDGRRQTLPFAADGMIPADLGVDTDQVSHLEAYLTSALLRDLTVIDTPGLGSLDATGVSRTALVLGATGDPGAPRSDTEVGRWAELDPVSANAVGGAEAVLYVVTQSVRADDELALAAFTAATAGRDAGPVNVLAVLNKVDTIVADSVSGAEGDLWRSALLVAGKQADALGPRVAGVVPAIGLLAESAQTGRFGSADVDALRALADLDDPTSATMLLSADLFTSWELPVPAGVRFRLLEMLDLYGIRRAIAELRAEPQITAGVLRERLLRWSGMAAVRVRLDAVFRARADGIKAAAALASITALAYGSGEPRERRCVQDGIEVLLATPQAHQLRLLEALTLIAGGAVDLPSGLAQEALRVGGGGDVGERLGLPGRPTADLAGHALERAAWWRSFASFGATPTQSRVAHVVHRTYFLIWQQLREQAG